MTGRNFFSLLESKWDEKKFLCVGLDPVLGAMPEEVRRESVRETYMRFNRAIIDATKDIVCAYKPNIAFYEAHGDEGMEALRETISYIQGLALDIPVILDAKRADIGNTSALYAEAVFDYLGADAVTVQPYLGSDAIAPFLERKEKGVIVLCRTSNPGSGEIQDVLVEGVPLYQHVARLVTEKWNRNDNCMVVVGATYPEELRMVREIVGTMPILVPGIGTQGGDIEQTVNAGKNARSRGLIISVSRGVIFASEGADFAAAARLKAQDLHDTISKLI